METERLTESRKKFKSDYQRIPNGFQQALVKSLDPGEEVYWWEMPSFWETYGPQRRFPRSFFAALIASSVFVWFGTLYWLYVFFFADDFQIIKFFEFFFVSFCVCLFFVIIEGIYFIIGYGFGLAEGLGQGLYVITDQRLIRIYQRLFFSRASGYTITSTSYRDIKEYTPLQGGDPLCLEASLGQLRLEMYPDDSGVLLYDPVFLYPISPTSLFSTREEATKAQDPDNLLIALNGFLHVSNLKEVIQHLQFITNGQLKSCTTTFTSKPPILRKETELKDMETKINEINQNPIDEETGSNKETETEKKTDSSTESPEEKERREERKRELVRHVIICASVVIIGITVIWIFGWLMSYLRLQHGEDIAAIGLIPSVFGSWGILISSFFALFWYGYGPRVDTFLISLSNLNVIDEEDWLDD